jgi:glycosyltransferase involved in cell wall biosynthesis
MIQLHQFARWIDREKFQLEFALPGEGPLPDSLKEIGEIVHAVDLNRRFDIRGYKSLTSLCRDRNVQIIHSHNARANVHARLARKYARLPVQISTIHNSVFNYDVSPARQHLYAAAERWTFKWCSHVIAVSEGIKKSLVSRYRFPAGAITVVPNGVDPDRVSPQSDRSAVLASLNVPDKSKVILQFGRLTPQKGFDILLKAVEKLKANYPDLIVLLAGDGPLRQELEGVAHNLGIGAVTRFLGHREKIGDLLGAADIVTLSSRSEGMPYTLLEAMSAGCAVVATEIPGIAEVIKTGDHAVSVPPEDPEALADAITDLIENPSRIGKLGEAARAHVQKCHTASGMVEKVELVYQNSMNHRIP